MTLIVSKYSITSSPLSIQYKSYANKINAPRINSKCILFMFALHPLVVAQRKGSRQTPILGVSIHMLCFHCYWIGHNFSRFVSPLCLLKKLAFFKCSPSAYFSFNLVYGILLPCHICQSFPLWLLYFCRTFIPQRTYISDIFISQVNYWE